MRVLIIGSGIAGLTAAIYSDGLGYETTLITKADEISYSNSDWAQGGVAYKGNQEISTDAFYEDIIQASGNMAYPYAVSFFVNNAPNILKKVLIDTLKIPFYKEGNYYKLTKEGAHSINRILFSEDRTGHAIVKSMIDYIKNKTNILVKTNYFAVELINVPHHSNDLKHVYYPPFCLGAYCLDGNTGNVSQEIADRTILASGGIGQIYKHSTNSKVATADGIAMAYRCGARIINMEYTQFHPTTLAIDESNNFLISEALRGEGATIINFRGEDFISKVNLNGSLASRDIVSRAIVEEMEKEKISHVYLDVSKIPIDQFKKRFPNIYKKCIDYKIDIEKEHIPILPAFHFSCGGVLTDVNGRSGIPNLYAIGESACTGLHGANRLASTSIMECVVMGYQSVHDDLKYNVDINPFVNEIKTWSNGSNEEYDPVLIKQDWNTLKFIMWNYVGIVRKTRRMSRALNDLMAMKNNVDRFYRDIKINREIVELRNAIQTAIIITNSALKNKHSYGCHYRVNLS